MSRNFPRLALILAATLSAAACESTKSANPLSPTVAGPIPGVNITQPKLLEPGSGWEVNADKQPLTLLIENASSTEYARSAICSRSRPIRTSGRRCSRRAAWRLARAGARA